jgi:hypothetical protein
MNTDLQKEYGLYLKNFQSWTKEHLGQYVLIKGTQVIDFFDSYDDALQYGLKIFGNVPFFIKIVSKQEEVHFFHQGVI